MVCSTEEILASQREARLGRLSYSACVLFLQGASVGCGLSYTGFVLPDHVRQASQVVLILVW